MSYKFRPALFLFTVSFIFACQTNQNDPYSQFEFAPANDSLVLPDQFAAVVVVDSTGVGRHLVVRENGDVYVHTRNKSEAGHGMVALRDENLDGKADVKEYFNAFPGTGIEIHKDHLYFSTTGRIYRSPLIADQLLPSNQIDTIAHLLGEKGGHVEKTFAFDQNGNMYVNVGSLSNACMQERRTKESPGDDPCGELEKRAGIWAFNDEQPNQKQTLNNRYATGIRNSVAISWNPMANSLYAVQHGRDDLHRFWPEVFTPEQNLELPSEEFLQVSEGDDFGWPYCYHDPSTNQKFLNPEYGGDGKKVGRCENVKMPLIGFPSHWAPNDIIFYKGDQFPEKYHKGAFIAFHGSWNRLGSSQAGFNVVFVPMKDGSPSGDWEVFADGFTGAASIVSPGLAKYRPCGLAEGPDGSLYIVDSRKGRVWRIVYRGNPG